MTFLKSATAVSAFLALAACGGGGGGGNGGGGASGNSAPTFTTSAAVTAVEQRDGEAVQAIITLQANDANGDTLTFSITGGADAALFDLVGATGELSFTQIFSFETPADANGDNIYEVEVSVGDGSNTTSRTFQVTLQNSTEGLNFRRVATGFADDSIIVFNPIDDTALIIAPDGSVQEYDPATNTVSAVGQIDLTGSNPSFPKQILDGFVGNIDDPALVFLTREGPFPQARMALSAAQPGDFANATELWSQTFASAQEPIEASLSYIRDERPHFAFSDGGNEVAAQDEDDFLGSVTEFELQFTNSQPTSVNLEESSFGLHNPIFISTNFEKKFILDRGPRFQELNTGQFSNSLNYEWPIRDGFEAVGFTGTVQGPLTPPAFAQEARVGDIGTWIGGTTIFGADDWSDLVVLVDDLGNFSTYNTATNVLEQRNLDFTPESGAIDQVTFVQGGESEKPETDGRGRFYVLNGDGELFLAEVD